MMNLQTVENLMPKPRFPVGWGKPQFKPNPSKSAIPARLIGKTILNVANNLAADWKTPRSDMGMGMGRS